MPCRVVPFHLTARTRATPQVGLFVAISLHGASTRCRQSALKGGFPRPSLTQRHTPTSSSTNNKQAPPCYSIATPITAYATAPIPSMHCSMRPYVMVTKASCSPISTIPRPALILCAWPNNDNSNP